MLLFDPSISLLEIYPKKIITKCAKNSCQDLLEMLFGQLQDEIKEVIYDSSI